MVDRFSHFAAFDWSGAATERPAGIAGAICANGDDAPRLIRPAHRWSRAEVLRWLREEMPDDTLVGLDLGLSLPFADCGAFLPGWAESPADARSLWHLVDCLCDDDPHLGASSFVDHAEAARHFRRHGGRRGDLFPAGRGRLRITEERQRQQGCNPYSNFNLVGAAQVGKASLTGMRLLHRLGPDIAVWPIDELPDQGPVIVEIYTAIAAMAGGRRPGASKIRSRPLLNQALAAIGSAPWRQRAPLDDHRADAILAAAWLRASAPRPDLWRPQGLTPAIARTEGWTFGVA